MPLPHAPTRLSPSIPGAWLLAALLLAGAALAGCRADSAGPPAAAADTTAAPPALALRLPTANDALLRGRDDAFYQGVNRAEIPGLRRAAWEGGQYGFVRSPARVPGEIGTHLIFSQLHEGLDISPTARDRAGEPLDSVVAVADGRVVHVNDHPSNSSYGRHVVVEHEWSGAPVYTLYAHLDRVDVRAGARLAQGAVLGRMGYTGRGLAKHRAHLHFEVALLLNRHFQPWFDAAYGQANPQGVFFGKNLAGLDAAALYRATAAEPSLTFAEFVRRQPVAYRLALPGDRPLDLLARYPWLADAPLDPDASGADTRSAPPPPCPAPRRRTLRRKTPRRRTRRRRARGWSGSRAPACPSRWRAGRRRPRSPRWSTWRPRSSAGGSACAASWRAATAPTTSRGAGAPTPPSSRRPTATCRRGSSGPRAPEGRL